ncbi:MAG: hypothetical protein ACR2F1_08120 [Nitrososphaeraceae archaeon]
MEFNIFTKTNDTENSIYFVRVKNISGEGMAEKCEGWITIEGNHSQTVWCKSISKL